MATPARVISLLAASAALVAFCSPTSVDGTNVQTGMWGGDHIAVEVTATGATVEFDCAHGTIDSVLTLDGNGRFDLAGTFTPEHPGPIRDDAPSETRAARYRGSLKDATLTLVITLTSTKDELTFTLTRDGRPRVFKCR